MALQGNWTGYRCSRCNRTFDRDFAGYVCSEDAGNLDIELDRGRISAQTGPAELSQASERSIWRYLALLPVRDPGNMGTPLRDVGWTPLYPSPALRRELGASDLWIKDDGRNPTASFKDRASAVVIARQRDIGAQVVITASTGNAGAALAGMAAAAQTRAVILAPATAPPAKIAQLMIYGANVVLIDGSYDDAFDLSVAAAQEFGWYCRNTGYNAFTAQGKKTAAYEICEQLTASKGGADPEHWIAPDAVLVSVGDGNIISGLYQGFQDLIDLGWIDRSPRLIGVQASGSAAIYQAWRQESDTIEPVNSLTLADSIGVDLPRDGYRALRAVRRTGGAYLTVDDVEILEAMADLARTAAVFAEPAGAAAHAGLIVALERKLIDPSDCVVSLITGSGIKDVKSAMKATGEPAIIPPDMGTLIEAVERMGLSQ